MQFARTEGLVAAPESSHALAQARREAASGEEKVIVIGLSGHGLLELGAYESYLSGHLEDDPLSDEALTAALAELAVI